MTGFFVGFYLLVSLLFALPLKREEDSFLEDVFWRAIMFVFWPFVMLIGLLLIS